MNETAHAIGHAERELRNPFPLLFLLLLGPLVLLGPELVKAIREHGWRNFDEED
jgi:hypothetical protein